MLTILMSGLLIFAMFFGAGNITFPLMIGAKYANNILASTLGLVIGDVFLAILGLVACTLCKANYHLFFSSFGKTFSFIIIMLALSLMGPFAAAPRCICVSYGGLNETGMINSFPLYSLFFSFLIFFLTLNKHRFLSILVNFLTPIKFLSIFFLLTISLYKAKLNLDFKWSNQAFFDGLHMGYQMMDMIASFFFSSTAYNYIQSKNLSHSTQSLVQDTLKASLLGGVLLFFVYTSFILIGSAYSDLLIHVQPENMLGVIAKHILGKYGLIIVGFTIAVACLVTSVVVIELFSKFLQKDILNKKISYTASLLISVCVTYVFSLIGFQKILFFLGSILSFLYPLLIIFSIIQIYRNKNLLFKC